MTKIFICGNWIGYILHGYMSTKVSEIVSAVTCGLVWHVDLSHAQTTIIHNTSKLLTVQSDCCHSWTFCNKSQFFSIWSKIHGTYVHRLNHNAILTHITEKTEINICTHDWIMLNHLITIPTIESCRTISAAVLSILYYMWRKLLPFYA